MATRASPPHKVSQRRGDAVSGRVTGGAPDAFSGCVAYGRVVRLVISVRRELLCSTAGRRRNAIGPECGTRHVAVLDTTRCSWHEIALIFWPCLVRLVARRAMAYSRHEIGRAAPANVDDVGGPQL